MFNFIKKLFKKEEVREEITLDKSDIKQWLYVFFEKKEQEKAEIESQFQAEISKRFHNIREKIPILETRYPDHDKLKNFSRNKIFLSLNISSALMVIPKNNATMIDMKI